MRLFFAISGGLTKPIILVEINQNSSHSPQKGGVVVSKWSRMHTTCVCQCWPYCATSSEFSIRWSASINTNRQCLPQESVKGIVVHLCCGTSLWSDNTFTAFGGTENHHRFEMILVHMKAASSCWVFVLDVSHAMTDRKMLSDIVYVLPTRCREASSLNFQRFPRPMHIESSNRKDHQLFNSIV